MGLRELEVNDEVALTAALLAQAADASHADDLVQAASQWLFTRRILISGARRLQDWARDAFAAVEAQILGAVNAAMPPAAVQKVVDAAYSARPGTDTTHLEWLKTRSKRHGPSTLTETVDKVRYLKELGAHDWNLSAVSLAKQQAYARQVQARRPVKTREIKPSRQLIELICFLRTTLLEVTDVALLQTSRRSQQLFREAADKAQSNRVRCTTGLTQQAAKARSVLLDESKTWQARVLEARDLLAELGEAASGSIVSLVRKALAEDSQRVRACLGALKDPDFGGRSGDPGLEQWKSWTDLQRQGVTELNQGVPRASGRPLRGIHCTGLRSTWADCCELCFSATTSPSRTSAARSTRF